MLGSPIGHSLSPVLHRAAYAALGLDWSYDARECTADGLPAMVRGAAATPAWAGFSLTMPLKLAVLPLLAEIEPLAAEVGAVNTVLPRRRGIAGANTDVPGMVAALREAGTDRVPSVAILGAGGTAQAALAALRELGQPSPTVLVRSLGAGGRVCRGGRTAGCEAAAAHLARGDPGRNRTRAVDRAGRRGRRADSAGACEVVFDVVYAPWPTPLAERARAAGAAVVERPGSAGASGVRAGAADDRPSGRSGGVAGRSGLICPV